MIQHGLITAPTAYGAVVSPVVQACTVADAACQDVVDSTPVVLGTLAIVVVALVVLIAIGIRRFDA